MVATITDFEPLWDELYPAEQARIVRLLVERVDLAPESLSVRLRAEGLQRPVVSERFVIRIVPFEALFGREDFV